MTNPFYGLPTVTLESSFLHLECLAEAGPRIVRLMLPGAPEANLLAELPDPVWSTPWGDYKMRGGHRLWHSPEAFPRTYHPDNSGPDGGAGTGGGWRRPESRSNRPSRDRHRDPEAHGAASSPDRASVTLIHSLTNEGTWPVEMAPWAVTQLALGGTAILPQGGGPEPDALLPNRRLVLWPYTSWQDPRLQLADDFIRLMAEAADRALKVGYLNRRGWLAYLRGQTLFVKRFPGAL